MVLPTYVGVILSAMVGGVDLLGTSHIRGGDPIIQIRYKLSNGGKIRCIN